MTNTQSSFIFTQRIQELIMPIIKTHLIRIISSKEKNPNVVSALTLGYLKDIESDILKILEPE